MLTHLSGLVGKKVPSVEAIAIHWELEEDRLEEELLSPSQSTHTISDGLDILLRGWQELQRVSFLLTLVILSLPSPERSERQSQMLPLQSGRKAAGA